MNYNKLFIVTLLLISSLLLNAQLLKNNASNLIAERDIYVDENSKIRYSDLITIKFNDNIIRVAKGTTKVELSKIKNDFAYKYFKNLKKKYGNFEIIKVAPNALWGDSLVINRRSGKLLRIPDWSQVVRISFSKLVPIDSVLNDLMRQSFIKYAEEPFQAYSMIEPNDEMYLKNENWALSNIMAIEAWDITKGDSSITIGIHDVFGNSTSHELHEDLKGKVKSHFNKFGNHGTIVAGVAGANTNNNIGIASLGWNLSLRFYCQSYCSSEILKAINDGVDVLNFSWLVTVDIPSIKDAIKTALASGVICVAAAGNNQNRLPTAVYPAAYDFGELGQVIAVSATEMNNGDEKFIEGWNYSPGYNPFVDPTNAFIDIAAPGRNIVILNKDGSHGYSNACGTSLSTPFVSALVGLILSVDSSLTQREIYNIITSSSDKIGQYNYDANGWNQYLGYGRINAYKALSLVAQSVNITGKKRTKIISNFFLEQNYPNPFNPSTTIKYVIPKRAKVSLKVYDVLGNLIEDLVNEVHLAGSYQVVFKAADNGKNYASGVYIFKLKADSFIEIKKGLLLK